MSSTNHPSSLWAITSFFNPASYARRIENYRRFRERLNVPLVAVELSFDGRFILTEGDADVLVQCRGGDVMWQKERMLNLGVRSLPSSCKEVICLDCDLFFFRAEWGKEVIDELAHVPMLQAYQVIHHLNFGVTQPQAEQAFAHQPSLAARVREGFAPEACFSWTSQRQKHVPCTPGGAVAYRRELLETHGLYDACIVGGGDLALMAAAFGCFDAAMNQLVMNERQRAHYLAWAEPFFKAVGGNVGATQVELFHLWHGSLGGRKYGQRHRDLQRFEFDPQNDLALDSSGLWRWNSDKPGLHTYLKDYFAGREEDEMPGANPSRPVIRTDDLSSFGGARFVPRKS